MENKGSYDFTIHMGVGKGTDFTVVNDIIIGDVGDPVGIVGDVNIVE